MALTSAIETTTSLKHACRLACCASRNACTTICTGSIPCYLHLPCQWQILHLLSNVRSSQPPNSIHDDKRNPAIWAQVISSSPALQAKPSDLLSKYQLILALRMLHSWLLQMSILRKKTRAQRDDLSMHSAQVNFIMSLPSKALRYHLGFTIHRHRHS